MTRLEDLTPGNLTTEDEEDLLFIARRTHAWLMDIKPLFESGRRGAALEREIGQLSSGRSYLGALNDPLKRLLGIVDG